MVHPIINSIINILTENKKCLKILISVVPWPLFDRFTVKVGNLTGNLFMYTDLFNNYLVLQDGFIWE